MVDKIKESTTEVSKLVMDMVKIKNEIERFDEVLALEEWNQELVFVLLPVTVCLTIYLIIGVIGNIAVLYIYLTKMNSEGRFFIPVLRGDIKKF